MKLNSKTFITKILISFSLIFSAYAGSVQKKLFLDYTKKINLKHEGVTREFLLYVPPTALRKAKAPVVFMFHGTSGDGLKFYKISQWKEKALDEGFIAVFPSSLSYKLCEPDRASRTTTKWSYSRLPEIICDKNAFIADDQSFFQEMVNFLKTNLRVDEDRIYVSGFSNGSAFVQELLVHNSHLIAAAAGNGGFLRMPQGPSEDVPFFNTVGSKDKNVLDLIGLVEVPVSRRCFSVPQIKEQVKQGLESFGLGSTYVSTKNRRMFQATFSDSNVINKELNILVLDELEHKYPNGKNYPIRMVDILWPFFERFSK